MVSWNISSCSSSRSKLLIFKWVRRALEYRPGDALFIESLEKDSQLLNEILDYVKIVSYLVAHLSELMDTFLGGSL